MEWLSLKSQEFPLNVQCFVFLLQLSLLFVESMYRFLFYLPKCIYNVLNVPDISLRTLQMPTHLFLVNTVWGRHFYSPLFQRKRWVLSFPNPTNRLSSKVLELWFQNWCCLLWFWINPLDLNDVLRDSKYPCKSGRWRDVSVKDVTFQKYGFDSPWKTTLTMWKAGTAIGIILMNAVWTEE